MVPQGKRSAGHKRWQGLIPLLMDHVRWAVDDTDLVGGLGIPIEARLRMVCVRLLYEVCRVQKLDAADLSRLHHYVDARVADVQFGRGV